MAPRWTHHAAQRWVERFPGEDPDELYARARKASKRLRSKIESGVKVNSRGGDYFLVTRRPQRSIVWVMGNPETIITVFVLPHRAQ